MYHVIGAGHVANEDGMMGKGQPSNLNRQIFSGSHSLYDAHQSQSEISSSNFISLSKAYLNTVGTLMS